MESMLFFRPKVADEAFARIVGEPFSKPREKNLLSGATRLYPVLIRIRSLKKSRCRPLMRLGYAFICAFA